MTNDPTLAPRIGAISTATREGECDVVLNCRGSHDARERSPGAPLSL